MRKLCKKNHIKLKQVILLVMKNGKFAEIRPKQIEERDKIDISPNLKVLPN